MFEFLKRSASPSSAALQKSVSQATDDIKQKWLQFHQTVHLKAEVPLARKIELFAQPVRHFLEAKYPEIAKGPAEVFWLIVFTAVLESGTHPTDRVNAAVEELGSKPLRAAPPEPNARGSAEKVRAPLSRVLPSFLPVLIERGIPGYESSRSSLAGEKRLTRQQIRALLSATAYLGTLEHAGSLNFDDSQVQEVLTRALLALPDLSAEEKVLALHLVDSFLSCKVIRENHAFDDWLCDVWWQEFQTIPYSYPSAMADTVAYGLTIQQSLNRCTLEN